MAHISGEGWDPPTAVKDRCEFHWFHVAVGSSLCVVALSPAPCWYVGHFEDSRMRKCDGPTCSMCGRGVGRQLRYVFSCVEITTRQIGILDVGKSVADMLREWTGRKGCFRGMMLEFTKASRSKHSRMEVHYIDRPEPSWMVTMQPVNLLEALESTWDRQVNGTHKPQRPAG